MNLGEIPRPENAALIAYHERNHFMGYKVPMEYCWYCQRNRAICRTKRRWTDPRTAHDMAMFINKSENWTKPIAPYHCRICLGWHLTSKTNRARRSRWKKQQRKQYRLEHAATLVSEVPD